MNDSTLPHSRSELLELHRDYITFGKDYLTLCYNYLNFYMGVLSAILAAMIAGIITNPSAIAPKRWTTLLVALAPALVLLLAPIAYQNFKIFYRRYVETWVTVVNIEALLPMAQKVPAGGTRPPFESREGGFIARYERPVVHNLIERAKREHWSAEQLVERVTSVGDTLINARCTLLLFATVAAACEAVLVLRFFALF